jgi:microcystin-dependent protein
MHWIIRSKKGFQATILTGHNHDNYYIRYDIAHTVAAGAARTLTAADRAQFRANAKVLRNDASDTFTGTLTVTGGDVIVTPPNEFVGFGTIPKGGIIMWSGSSIPTGWSLCNGTNGTPDLRNKFIVGSGTTYSIGASGGSESVTLSVAQMPIHTHAGGTAGSHRHDFKPLGTSREGGNSPSHGILPKTCPNALDENDNNNCENEFSPRFTDKPNPYDPETRHVMDYAGGHSHTMSAQGGGQAHENRPPYYALAFIMRTL